MQWLGDLLQHRREGLDPEFGAARILEQMVREVGDRPLAIDLAYRAYAGLSDDARMHDLARRTIALETRLFELYTLDPWRAAPGPSADCIHADRLGTESHGHWRPRSGAAICRKPVVCEHSNRRAQPIQTPILTRAGRCGRAVRWCFAQRSEALERLS